MKRSAWILMIVVAIALGGAAAFHFWPRPDPLLSPQIQKQVSFVVYLPDNKWTTTRQDISLHNGILSIRTARSGDILSLSEQSTPSVFNDIPQYYPSLITKLNSYSNFGTVNGVVYLTHPKELNGQQQAVLNHNGTLIFIHPNHSLSDDDWRRFFNGLTVVKPE